MKDLDKIHTLLDPKKAEDLAKSLKKDDPEWDYKPVHEDGKFSFIEVYDETGAKVGVL